MISFKLKNLFARLSSSLPLREGLGVGLLLFMGSASLMAEGDPFGEVANYQNNMTLAGAVYLDGQVLGTEAVVAAYCGSTLRGKQSPNDKGELYLSIGGDISGDKIYFKVCTGGRVIEVDQGLTYANNAQIGKTSPYIINLPTPIVTTPTTEGWATTCLPYDAEVPTGVEVWNATAIEDHELVMSKVTAGTILPANTPVLVKSEGLTSYEWLSRVVLDDSSLITFGSSLLRGTTKETAVDANTVLTLGYSNEGNNELRFWLFAGTTIKANRAYIADFPSNSRGVTFRLDEYSSIREIVNRKYVDSKCFDLQGRRVSSLTSHPCWKKGHHGQIIIIK
jgi:hypothetical protein